jgi:cation-transporting ATPase 13A3/4/5
MFKFMALYSFIYFVSVMCLYFIGSNLGDWAYFYVDMIALLPLNVFMSWTNPYENLTKDIPPGALLSFPILLSIFGQVSIQAIF